METVEKINVVLLVTKKIWSSVNPVCKKHPESAKWCSNKPVTMNKQKNCSCVVQMFFKTIGITLQQFVCNYNFVDYKHCPLRSFLTLCSNMDAAYKQQLCSNGFFCSLPSELSNLCYFRRIYTMWFLLHLSCCHNLFTFQKFCASVDKHFQFLMSPHDNC